MEKKGIIIYTGKYGATQQYAEWLYSSLHLPLNITANIGNTALQRCDYVVLGSPVYYGKLLIEDWIRQHTPVLYAKKIFLFIVSGTPSDNTKKLQGYTEESVPPEIRNFCKYYFLPGRMIMKNLSWWHRMMMKVGAMLEKDTELKKTMRLDYDNVKKENLDELLKDINKMAAVEYQNPQTPWKVLPQQDKIA